MSEAAIKLDKLEIDALSELVNIGVGRAAASLRHMVGEEVLLSVPSAEIMQREQAWGLIEKDSGGGLVAIHQHFEGSFSGCALLVFPEVKSLELVRAVVRTDLPLEDIVDLEQEALAETGNIVLNACLATIANILKQNLKMSLPQVRRGNGATLLGDACGDVPGDLLLFLYISFTVNSQNIHGYIVMLMDLPSLATLKQLIGEYIAGLTCQRA